MKGKKRSWRDRETNEADGGEEGEKCQGFTCDRLLVTRFMWLVGVLLFT